MFVSLFGLQFVLFAAKLQAMYVDSEMEHLDHLNYESWITWKFKIQLILNLQGLGFALKVDKPSEPTDSSSAEEKAKYENWKRSNYLSLLLMKSKMANYIYSILSSRTKKSNNAKQIFDALKELIMNGERTRAPSMLKELMTMRYDGQGDVCQHLLKMDNLARRLRDVDVVLPEYLINQLALDSLPSQFAPVRLAYITQDEKWEFNRLIRSCRDLEGLISLRDKRGSTEENENESGHGKGINYQKRRNISVSLVGRRGT